MLAVKGTNNFQLPSDLKSGIYYIEMRSEKNNKIYKLIIQ